MVFKTANVFDLIDHHQVYEYDRIIPCIAQKINKTRHLPLDPCVIVIFCVSVAFGADLAAI